MSRALRFTGELCSGEMQDLAAMLGPVEFTLASGRTVSPMAVAPWSDDTGPDHDGLPGVLKRLRGDWACVPFGMTAPPAGLPADWRNLDASAPPDTDHDPHGFCSNNPWSLTPIGATGVHAEIQYPARHPIARLERTASARQGAAAVDVSLTVHPRRDVTLPIGLHPTFRLPDRPGAARLSFGGADVKAWTYPVPAEPGRSRIRANQRDVTLDAIAASDGGSVDIRTLPFDGESEDIVLLTGTEGRVELSDHDGGYKVALEWDHRQLPSCLLWLSNFGRQFYPWNGRFRALGIEPIAGAFDLRLPYRGATNPLSAAGLTTGVTFRAGTPWTTRYAISCAAP